jgi:hypothetical protein
VHAAGAVLVRTNGPAHKRLMLIATINLVIPAVARWPFLSPQHILLAIQVSLIALLLFVLFDLARTHRVHLADPVPHGRGSVRFMNSAKSSY